MYPRNREVAAPHSAEHIAEPLTRGVPKSANGRSNGHNPALDALAKRAFQKLGAPVDAFAVAAILESFGMRDVDAVEKFGKRDIFDLAEAVYARCQEVLKRRARARARLNTAQAHRTPRFIYLRRLFYSAPWLLQVVVLLTRGYALGIYEEFSDEQATLIVVALMFSLVVCGGFMQIIGRMLALHPPKQQPILARLLYRRTLALGGLTAGAIAFLLLAADVRGGEVGVSSSYFLLFSWMWLATAGLYALERPFALLLVTGMGLLGTGIAFEALRWNIYAAHCLGMAITGMLAFGLVEQRFAQYAGKSHDHDSGVALAEPLSAFVPYFMYGTFYFVLLFIDRVVGWSVNPPRYALWFRPGYEFGLVIALVPLFLALPLLEYIAHRSVWQMSAIQEQFSALEIEAHNRLYRRRQRGYVIRLLVVFFVVAAIVYGAVRLAQQYFPQLAVLNGISFQVYWGGIFGYGLLLWGLANSVYLFAMARPWPVVRALVLACFADVLIGFLLSRTGGYWLSVVGLAVGALIFSLITQRAVGRGLRKIDYYGYASY